MNGIKLINNATAVFIKVIDKLTKGIELCEKEIKEQEDVIAEANTKRNEAEQATTKAKKLVANIQKMLE